MSRLVLLMFVGELMLLTYFSNLMSWEPADARAHVYTAWSMVWSGDIDLSEFPPIPPFRSVTLGALTIAPYLPGNALIFSPLALLAGLAGVPPTSDVLVAVIGKLVSTVFLVAGILASFEAVAPRTSPRVALFITFALAFGTAAASVASQVFYEHGTSIGLLGTAMVLVLRSRRPALAGLPLGLAVLVRPTNIFPAAAILATLLPGPREKLLRALLWMAPSAAFLAVFDQLAFGAPWAIPRPLPETDPSMGGIAGLLISPSRGLFVYSPFLAVPLAAFLASWRWPADARVILLRVGSIAFVATLIVYGTYREWWGGTEYGDRYLVDLLPLYAVGWAETFARGWMRSPIVRGLVAVAVGWGVLLHLLGMTVGRFDWHGLHWDLTPPIAETPWRLWSWNQPEWAFFLMRMVTEPPPPSIISCAVLAMVTLAFALIGRRLARGTAA